MFVRSRKALFALAASTAALTACSPEPVEPAQDQSSPFAETGLALDLVPEGRSLPFVPVATSAACVVGGSSQQIVLPPGYTQSLIASEGAGFPDLSDMLTGRHSGSES